MKLQPAAVFGENMVLQRDKQIKVWGRCAAGDTVTVRLNRQYAEAPSVNGEWEVALAPEAALEKTSLVIYSRLTGETVIFSNVAIGEVWLAGGQSNMEFLMKYDVDFPETKDIESDTLLRCYTCPQTAFKGFMETEGCPNDGFWRIWDKEEDRKRFSAVAGYMGMVLRKKLNVPVGIVSCNWGGSPAAAWTALEDLQKQEVLDRILKWHEEACANTDWPKYIAASEEKTPEKTPEQQAFEDKFMMGEFGREFFENFDPSTMPVPDFAPYSPGPRSIVRPAGLYEHMLKKIAPYAIRGFLWYQGEDDDARDWADIYDVSMVTMINSWRRLWNEELPFYQIELAPFEGVGVTAAKKYDLMRHQQAKAAEELNNVFDICILDAGEPYNIHPRRKKMVGERLGRIVMKHTYGDGSLTADCPKMSRAERNEGIIISFENAAEGLEIKGDLKKYLLLSCGEEQLDYGASVDGNRLILKGEFPEEPLTVRFCESNYCEDPLYNSEGNPAFQFTCEV